MLKLRLAVTLFALFFTTSAFAQLKPYQDYDISDNVWSITTVQVNANMINNYLEGIEKTWVASQKVAKDLKHIEDYYVYTSDLPNSGSFNVLLVTRYKSGADLAPSKARYEAFMKEWGAEREAQNEKIVKDYPAMRNITGEYQMHRVTFK
jgi:hypothetical protein